MTDLLTLGTGFVIGIAVAIIPVLLTNRQQHLEARFQFYRDKADVISGYVASVYQMARDLADVGVNLGVMGHTISWSPTVDNQPSLEESRASLSRRLDNLKERYDKFQEDGTLVLMPEKLIIAMREADERVHILRDMLGTTPDLGGYFRGNPQRFDYLITQALRSVEVVRETLQKELGLKTTDESKYLKA